MRSHVLIAALALAACSKDNSTGPNSSAQQYVGSYALTSVDSHTLPAQTNWLYDPTVGVSVAHNKILSSTLTIQGDGHFTIATSDSTAWDGARYTALENVPNSGTWTAAAKGILLKYASRVDESVLLSDTDLQVLTDSPPYAMASWEYARK